MRIFHISISASSCSTSMPLILSGELRLRACGRRAEARERGAGRKALKGETGGSRGEIQEILFAPERESKLFVIYWVIRSYG